MQKKLRQGFGRAIRTETDTCVVSILDIRAVKGGKYHEDVMCALPVSYTHLDVYKRQEDVSVLEENLIAGTVDHHELVSKNGIILIKDTAENLSLSAQLGDEVKVDFLTKDGQTITKSYTIMGIVSNFNHPAFNMCFAMPEELMNEACKMDCSGTISVISEPDKACLLYTSVPYFYL